MPFVALPYLMYVPDLLSTIRNTNLRRCLDFQALASMAGKHAFACSCGPGTLILLPKQVHFPYPGHPGTNQKLHNTLTHKGLVLESFSTPTRPT